LRSADLRSAILLNTDLHAAKNLNSQQLERENAPLICNAALPLELEAYKDRDCEQLPQVLANRYPIEFTSLDEAKAFVDEQRQQEWE
ncbi:MAG: pentapeptide repeat-containing protein, partial [Almyronema sp.]